MNRKATSPAHTAGPWAVTHFENETQVFARNRMIAGQLFDPENEPTLEELEANARLIAAAPELLEALKTLREDMRMLRDGEWLPESDGEACNASIDLADEAIAKAYAPAA